MALSKNENNLSHNLNPILFKACRQGDLKLLEEYINILSPADISTIRDEQKATLLHYAARYGHLHILEYLIERKHLDINQLRTRHGATCAHDAAVCDQVEILNYIFHYQQLNNSNKQYLSEKIRWDIRDDQGNTILHLAAAYGSQRALHYLLEHESADPHTRSYNSYQAIHYASSYGHTNCVKLLLTFAPDTVNEQTSALLTPIYLACQNGSLDTIKILTSHGANFKLRNENGLNCLHAACQNSHLHVVQWLIETQNANVDDVDYMNNTPLHYAAANGNQSILTYLLEKNAKILTSSNGNTPLHAAAENGQQSACAILIERGHCPVSSKNNSQLTAIDLAHYYGYSSLANELRLHTNSSSLSDKFSSNSSKIQLENATIVRLVVKKRNTERCDASNQVNENDLPNSIFSPKNLVNNRFDLSELRARVEEHEASRAGTVNNGEPYTNVLMHSMDSLNQQNRNRPRSKLPQQTYAPWLKMGNMSPDVFQKEIQKASSNLRKVRRDSLVRKDNENAESNKRQSQSLDRLVMSSVTNNHISSSPYYDNQNNTKLNKYETQTRPAIVPIARPHQFITPSSQSTSQVDEPQWKRDLRKRLRATNNGMLS